MDGIIEIFGKRLKVVKDNNDSADYCFKCAIKYACFNVIGLGIICKDARGRTNRHFELINDKLKEKSNMKTTELMIGDWVLVDKEPIQIKQVCEDCIICDFGDGDEEVECFEPIPLTADILAKNGLEKRCSDELVLFDILLFVISLIHKGCGCVKELVAKMKSVKTANMFTNCNRL